MKKKIHFFFRRPSLGNGYKNEKNISFVGRQMRKERFPVAHLDIEEVSQFYQVIKQKS